MNKKTILFLVFALIVISFSLCGLFYYVIDSYSKSQSGDTDEQGNSEFDIQKFKSLEEMKEFLAENNTASLGPIGMSAFSISKESGMLNESDLSTGTQRMDAEIRQSDTYVQVTGVDEPDMLKSNGKEIFLSRKSDFYYIEDLVTINTTELSTEPSFLPPQDDNTKIIQVYPPEDISTKSTIKEAGELLLIDDTLLVISNNYVQAYDTSSVTNPETTWKFQLESGSYISDARLIDKYLYLVAQTSTDSFDKCAVPLTKTINIRCTDIYYPSQSLNATTTYTILKVDTQDGKVTKNNSFLGESSNTVVYMNQNNIYLTYTLSKDQYTIMYDLLVNSNNDILPLSVVNSLKKINGYDISTGSKNAEIFEILDKYQKGLSEAERETFLEKMETESESYFTDHKRELTETGIVQLSTDDLVLKNSTKVPGSIISQFSMDESEGYFRIATTTQNWQSNVESFSDLYVLDNNLETVGKILDYGLDEQIYGVRFMGDKAYVVTFKQIDPFYVMDLSDPKNPVIAGELKIPGYSSFLHQIDKNLVVGIGQEDNKVKVALFDVSDPSDPTELAKVILDDYWSAIQESHHAFLIDTKHKVFVVPASEASYIYSYANNDLVLKKKIFDINAERSIYIGDYLYMIGTSEIKVVDENTWEIIERFQVK